MRAPLWLTFYTKAPKVATQELSQQLIATAADDYVRQHGRVSCLLKILMGRNPFHYFETLIEIAVIHTIIL